MEKITDIFGNIVINKNVPILLITTKINDGLLTKITDGQIDSIWKVNYNKINEMLKKNNIMSNDYKTFGNYWYPHIRCTFYITILLANTKYNFISYPKDFINIGSYENGYIWKPICNNNYIELGLIFSKIKPNINDICTISYIYTTNYNGKNDVMNNYTNYNEFYLLGSHNIPRKTIYRARFIKKNKILKIKNIYGNKYLNKNNMDNIIFTTNPTNIVYTTDGQININNKCLERIYANENNLSILLKECNDSDAQKWFPLGIPNTISNPEYNIVSQNDMLYMTLLSDGDDEMKKNIIATENLNGNKKQIFKFENIKNDNIIFNKNNSQMMLVESNNPWYINKLNTNPLKLHVNNLHENDSFQDLITNDSDADLLPSLNTISSNASYYPNKITDTAMRHSYNNFTICSQCSKNNKNNKNDKGNNKIENFTNDYDSDFFNKNQLIIIILLIIIITIIFILTT